MEKLIDVQKKVEGILMTSPKTRDSDDLLYFEIIESINPGLTAKEVFTNRESHGLPPYETVRRARQKLQADRPDLRGTIRTQIHRKEKEEQFLAYANG